MAISPQSLRAAFAGGLCLASVTTAAGFANADVVLTPPTQAQQNSQAGPLGPIGQASENAVDGSNVTLRNETNLYGNTPKTFVVKTTSDGSPEAPETYRGTLAPGQSMELAGDNSGMSCLDVRTHIYVDGQLKLVLGATNTGIGYPYSLVKAGIYKGKSASTMYSFLAVNEAKTAIDSDYGAKVWSFRGGDSNDRKNFILAVWHIPTENTVDTP